jgi:hypothetical protein
LRRLHWRRGLRLRGLLGLHGSDLSFERNHTVFKFPDALLQRGILRGSIRGSGLLRDQWNGADTCRE